jgi:hypothetical protein
MQTKPEIEIEANLVRMNKRIGDRVLQISITSHAQADREIISLGVRQLDGTFIKLAEPGDSHNLLPLRIKPRETKTFEPQPHKSVSYDEAIIAIEDDYHNKYSAPVKLIDNPGL